MKCADGDLKSALRLLTSEDTTADSAGTLHELKAKYPAAPENEGIAIALTYLNTSPLRVEPDNVLEVLTSMQSGSGADLDGIRPLHLQELIDKKTAESGRRLLAAVTKLLNLLLSGNVPNLAKNAFYGSSICALTRKEGGMRTIAVGCTYRRPAAKLSVNI